MSKNTIHIRRAVTADWPDMRRIFLEGIATGQASFETAETVPTDWQSWIRHKHGESAHVLTNESGTVLAWGVLAPTSARLCYRGVAETQLYVAGKLRGSGLGRHMLRCLIHYADRHGLWTLQAVVFPENTASLSLFRGAGFREVGRREKIARMNGEWRDTLLLERRSPTIW